MYIIHAVVTMCYSNMQQFVYIYLDFVITAWSTFPLFLFVCYVVTKSEGC